MRPVRVGQRRPDAEELGHPHSGLSTKVRAATDALGNPAYPLFGTGQRHDVTRSHELVDGFKPEAVVAGKGYDADHLRDAIRGMAAEIFIPPLSDRKKSSAYNKALYRKGNPVERFFNKLEQFRRIVTRYDKFLPNYEGFVQLAVVAILLQ